MYSKLVLLPSWDVFKPILLEERDVAVPLPPLGGTTEARKIRPKFAPTVLPLLYEDWQYVLSHLAVATTTTDDCSSTEAVVLAEIEKQCESYYQWIIQYRLALRKSFVKCFPDNNTSLQDPSCCRCSSRHLQELTSLLSEYRTLLIQSRSEQWDVAMRRQVQQGGGEKEEFWKKLSEELETAVTAEEKDTTFSSFVVADGVENPNSWKYGFRNWRNSVLNDTTGTTTNHCLSKGFPIHFKTTSSTGTTCKLHVRFNFSWEGGLSSYDSDVELAIVTYNLLVCSLLEFALDYETMDSVSTNNLCESAHTHYNTAGSGSELLALSEACTNTLNFFKWFDPSIIVPDCSNLYGIGKPPQQGSSGPTAAQVTLEANMEHLIASNLLSSVDLCDGVFNEKIRLSRVRYTTANNNGGGPNPNKEEGRIGWSAKSFESQFKAHYQHLQRVRNRCVENVSLLEELLYVLDQVDKNARGTIDFIVPSENISVKGKEEAEEEIVEEPNSSSFLLLERLLGTKTLKECSISLKLNREHISYMGKILEMFIVLSDLDLVRLTSFSKVYNADSSTAAVITTTKEARETGLNCWTFFYGILKGGSDSKLQLDNAFAAVIQKYHEISSHLIIKQHRLAGVLPLTQQTQRSASNHKAAVIISEIHEELDMWVSAIGKTWDELTLTGKKIPDCKTLEALNEWLTIPDIAAGAHTDLIHSRPYELMGMGKIVSYGQMLGSYLQCLFSHFMALQETFVFKDNLGNSNVHEVNGLFYYEPKLFPPGKSIALLKADVSRLAYLTTIGSRNPHLVLNGRSCEQLRWLLNTIVCTQKILQKYQRTNHIKSPTVANITLPPKFTRLSRPIPLRVGQTHEKFLSKIITNLLQSALGASQRVLLWRKVQRPAAAAVTALLHHTTTTSTTRKEILPQSPSLMTAHHHNNQILQIHERMYNILQFLLGKVELSAVNHPQVLRNLPRLSSRVNVRDLCTEEEIEEDMLRIFVIFWTVNGGIMQLELLLRHSQPPPLPLPLPSDCYMRPLVDIFLFACSIDFKRKCLERMYENCL